MSAAGPLSVAIKIRFADVDFARIVYYPRFFHYFHIAFEELFEHDLGVRYSEVMQDEQIGYPAVHTECDYLSPVRFGDVLRIDVTCARLGSKSVTLRYRGYLQDDTLCVDGRVTCARGS